MTERSDSVVLHFIVGVFLVPFILVFGFYIFAFGEDGPGGGFQAGAIMAAAAALLHMAVGRSWAHRRFNVMVLRWVTYIGVGVFVVAGLLPMLYGQSFLDYGALPFLGDEEAERRAWGVFIVEGGIALAVFGVLTAIFDGLTQPGSRGVKEEACDKGSGAEEGPETADA